MIHKPTSKTTTKVATTSTKDGDNSTIITLDNVVRNDTNKNEVCQITTTNELLQDGRSVKSKKVDTIRIDDKSKVLEVDTDRERTTGRPDGMDGQTEQGTSNTTGYERNEHALDIKRKEREVNDRTNDSKVVNDGMIQMDTDTYPEDNRAKMVQVERVSSTEGTGEEKATTVQAEDDEKRYNQDEDEIMVHDSDGEEIVDDLQSSEWDENEQLKRSNKGIQNGCVIARRQQLIKQPTSHAQLVSGSGITKTSGSILKTVHKTTKLPGTVTSKINVPSRVRFNPTPMIKVITKMETDKSTVIKERGVYMVDDMEKFTTPTKIEYNLSNKIGNFHIRDAVQELFKKMSNEDSAIRILTLDKSKVVWDINSTLEESDIFQDNFKMREQSYRKGNKKVTLYCLVESRFTINRLKYAPPVRDHIFANNIWIRPDLYSTHIVSCPGFLTLIHPKMTNKVDLTNELIQALQTVDINETEKVVQEWTTEKNQDNKTKDTVLPNFHLETNQRKWGDITTEVLSLHCSMEDAQYLKYLFAEASTQQKLTRGLFVPTGIHLMEGKEVLRDLLKEHQAYVSTLTSCQIGGIATQDMEATDKTSESIRKLLMKMDGVEAVEKMYHTDYSRQWLLIIEKEKIHKLVTQVQQNLPQLYNRRITKNPKLITYKLDTGITGYRLMETEGNNGKIGSYAEVLKRRFPTVEENTGTLSNTRIQVSRKDGSPTQKAVTEEMNKQVGATSGGHSTNIRHQRDGTAEQEKVLQRNERGQINDREEDNSGDETQPSNTDREDVTNNIQEKIQTLERGFNDRLVELEQSNKRLLENIDARIEKQVERALDKKADQISNTIAAMVTRRLMKAITGINTVHKQKQIQANNQVIENRITQESPLKTRNDDLDTMDVEEIEHNTDQEIYPRTDTTTIKPETTAKNQNTTQTDRPHDIIQDSVTGEK